MKNFYTHCLIKTSFFFMMGYYFIPSYTYTQPNDIKEGKRSYNTNKIQVYSTTIIPQNLSSRKITNDKNNITNNNLINISKTKNNITTVTTIKVTNLPYMAIYIPWNYQQELDTFHLELIVYFINIAIRRGYNYFAIQQVECFNVEKNSIASVKCEYLYKHIITTTKNILKNYEKEDVVIINSELVKNSITSNIINSYGGFFLLAKSI